MNKKIVFVGGDKRQLYAAEKLMNAGYEVYMSGFERLKNPALPELEDFYCSDVLVLPVTGIKDGAVPADYSDKEIKLDNKKLVGKLVIMGKSKTLGKADCRACDLLTREDFARANALPSAEGAVMTAMGSFEGTISGSRCLVIGYGRIGKALSRMLGALNAEVTVSTRSAEKAACIESDGNTAVKTSDLKSLDGFDIAFNTADALVLDRGVLENSSNSTLIIDLASGAGGVDFKAAEELGLRAVHALGLPGKYSPKTAGEIISDAVLTILKEE